MKIANREIGKGHKPYIIAEMSGNHNGDNYLAIDPENKNRVFDIRYSMLPNHISGLWGIEIDYDGTEEQHIKYITNRSLSQRRFRDLIDMILND